MYLPVVSLHRIRWVFLFLAMGVLQASPRNASFEIKSDPASGQITSLRQAGDTNRVEFIRAGQSLGAVEVRARRAGEAWATVKEGAFGVKITSRFRENGAELFWQIRIQNGGEAAVEIGDLALPLPMNTEYVWDQEETFLRRVFKHAFIAGNGSFLHWLPVGGQAPFLVMQPRAGTGLEYFTATDMDYAFGRERFTVFIHSKASAEMERRGSWRQPRSSRFVAPGEQAAYEFVLGWANSYEGARDLLYRNGGCDLYVAPGMVVPRDLSAKLALRTHQAVTRIEPEFPASTQVRRLGRSGRNTQLFEVQFRKLGENVLRVRGPGGRLSTLEFFVTEPMETLVKKRAAFIANHQQHRDPSKWYDGLFSLWERREPSGQNLLGPDHLGEQHPYAVSGSDDPCNGKSILLAEKNVAYPDMIRHQPSIYARGAPPS